MRMPTPQWPTGAVHSGSAAGRGPTAAGVRRHETSRLSALRSGLRASRALPSSLSLSLIHVPRTNACPPAPVPHRTARRSYYSLYSRSRVLAADQHALGTYVLRAAATGRRRPLLCALDHGEARPVHRHWPAVTWVCEAHTRTKQAGCEKTAGSSAKGGARLSLSRPNRQRACTVLCVRDLPTASVPRRDSTAG